MNPCTHNPVVLLERNETRRMSSTDTWPTVLDWLAVEKLEETLPSSSLNEHVLCDGELAEVMANHFWLDFNLVELLYNDE
jgi:hypothetical protein